MDPAEKLKLNLRAALNCLRERESSELVKHIVHDVAHLVTVIGERRLRDQYQDIISLGEDSNIYRHAQRDVIASRISSSPKSRLVLSRSAADADCEDDSERIQEANRDLLDKVGTMRIAVRHMEDKRKEEVLAVTLELDKYRKLLSETEKSLLTERMLNRKLWHQIEKGSPRTARCGLPRMPMGHITARSQSCHTSENSMDSDSCDNGRFGFGALTVRSCRTGCHCMHQSSTPRINRPISAKSRKHRRDHDYS